MKKLLLAAAMTAAMAAPSFAMDAVSDKALDNVTAGFLNFNIKANVLVLSGTTNSTQALTILSSNKGNISVTNYQNIGSTIVLGTD